MQNILHFDSISCVPTLQSAAKLKRRFSADYVQECVNMIKLIFDIYFFIYFSIAFYWAGFTVAQRERAQEDLRSHTKVPHLTHPPFACILGSPYSFRIVRGFFYVPQNYQHSRNCETGPPAYHSYSRRLESLTICR